MIRPIYTPRGLRRQIQAALGYSQPTIIKALNGTFNAANAEEKARAERIRKYALNNGGAEAY